MMEVVVIAKLLVEIVARTVLFARAIAGHVVVELPPLQPPPLLQQPPQPPYPPQLNPPQPPLSQTARLIHGLEHQLVVAVHQLA